MMAAPLSAVSPPITIKTAARTLSTMRRVMHWTLEGLSQSPNP
jgi:hypothetical protein